MPVQNHIDSYIEKFSCPCFEKVITQKDLNHGEIPSPMAANNNTNTVLASPDEAEITS